MEQAHSHTLRDTSPVASLDYTLFVRPPSWTAGPHDPIPLAPHWTWSALIAAQLPVLIELLNGGHCAIVGIRPHRPADYFKIRYKEAHFGLPASCLFQPHDLEPLLGHLAFCYRLANTISQHSFIDAATLRSNLNLTLPQGIAPSSTRALQIEECVRDMTESLGGHVLY